MDAEGTTVHSLKDAARLFRDPPAVDTIRLMCKDGRLQAHQDEKGRWTILVPPDPDLIVQRRKKGRHSAATYPALDDDRAAQIAVLTAERDQARDEIYFLRQEVTGSRLERRVLLEQIFTMQQQLALPAPEPTPWWLRLLQQWGWVRHPVSVEATADSEPSPLRLARP